jgi:hypothetical protein
MSSRRFGLVPRALLCAGLLLPSLTGAQDLQPPAHVALVDGAATLEREITAEPATSGVPFLAGDRIRTARGRVEVLFPDGSALHVDEHTSVELLSTGLLRLMEGRILLVVAGVGDPGRAVRFQIDTPVATAATDGPGEYRVSLLAGPSGVDTELAVWRGWGTLSTERGSTPLVAGERSVAGDNGAPSPPLAFNSARLDAFARWSDALRRRAGSASAQYLPSDLRVYGDTFDQYGSWQQDDSYGYVWYPSVAPGWRPYYHGYWRSLPVYGWTWIGLDPWGWPTHHFGRWGYQRSRWFWKPGRAYAPAWVHWASAPGYVGWCPLGFDNRPVFALSASFGTPWAGWTVVAQGSFGARHHYVHASAIAPSRLPRPESFAPHAGAPVLARAAPRSFSASSGPVASSTDRPTRAVSRRAVGTVRGSESDGVVQTSQPPVSPSPGRRVVSQPAAGSSASLETARERSRAVPFGDFRRQTSAAGESQAAPSPAEPEIRTGAERRAVRSGPEPTRPAGPSSSEAQGPPGWSLPGAPGSSRARQSVPRREGSGAAPSTPEARPPAVSGQGGTWRPRDAARAPGSGDSSPEVRRGAVARQPAAASRPDSGNSTNAFGSARPSPPAPRSSGPSDARSGSARSGGQARVARSAPADQAPASSAPQGGSARRR